MSATNHHPSKDAYFSLSPENEHDFFLRHHRARLLFSPLFLQKASELTAFPLRRDWKREPDPSLSFYYPASAQRRGLFPCPFFLFPLQQAAALEWTAFLPPSLRRGAPFPCRPRRLGDLLFDQLLRLFSRAARSRTFFPAECCCPHPFSSGLCVPSRDLHIQTRDAGPLPPPSFFLFPSDRDESSNSRWKR